MPLRKERLDVFQLVADPTRRTLIELLEESEHAVQDLADHFDISLSAISQQLKVLKLAGVVSDRRDGRRRLYRLHPEALEGMADWALRRCERFWNDRLGRLGARLEEGKSR